MRRTAAVSGLSGGVPGFGPFLYSPYAAARVIRYAPKMLHFSIVAARGLGGDGCRANARPIRVSAAYAFRRVGRRISGNLANRVCKTARVAKTPVL